MSLFQQSVLKQHQKLQDKTLVEKAYKKFSKYFLNPAIQDNIRSSKEEEYQGIFLTELFVNVLGYTLKPKVDFNLVAEYKNQNNARKADGAILHNDIAIGVIELKGTNTKDLESIRKQAFDYKANQKGCVYVITSNFEKLRFYINDATEFEEFDLFQLSPERFELLYLCLQKDNVINNVPLKIKEASVVEEEQITKKFYKDYSLFKRELYRDLVKRNAKQLKAKASSVSIEPQTEEEKEEQLKLEKNVKLTLFKKSQKLIDRYLFIFFAEDRGLLPANSTQQILDKWKADLDFGDDRPLYILFKQYFNFLDQGRAGTSKRAEIYAYNGGLFKEDKTLDSLDIDNDLLYKHTSKLAAYDFESQVDVNILGHIFENSLNEIESVNAEIEGGDFDKQKSKRKKDGVFYTPKYITKYIVENTIGKLCEEKKTELGFKEEEYFKGRKINGKKRPEGTIKKLVTILDEYRDWLLQLTICDPACGSGAFLNQALDFLIKEHTYIDELKTKVLGGGLQFPDIENTILENNIYGVDLNEESVEIAKLSLWLRTAQPRRKLNDLSSNIKCGNSLIDSKAIAGDKAFNWKEQFPKVFEKGGFDVIIGNPPYLGGRDWKDSDGRNYEYLLNKYEVSEYQFDMYVLFWEKGIKLLKDDGLLGFITPITWLNNQKTKKLRKFILKNTTILEMIDFSEVNVFKDAVVLTMIGILQNTSFKEGLEVRTLKPRFENFDLDYNYINQSAWINDELNIINTNLKNEDTVILNKIEKKGNPLENFSTVKFGIKIYETGKGKPSQSKNDAKEKIFESNCKIDETYRPYLEGKDIDTYKTLYKGKWLKYGENLAAPRSQDLFEGERLLVRRIVGKKLIATFTNCNYVTSQLLQIVKPNSQINSKEILALLNSNLLAYYFRKKYNRIDKTFPEIRVYELRSLPVLSNTIHQSILEENVNNILFVNENLEQIYNKFQNYLKQTFKLKKLSKKLQNWHELEFGDFIKELNKAIKANNKLRVKDGLEEVPPLTKKDEFEWLDLFEENKQKAQALQTQINQTDKEIDAMVYELYGLTDEEILIVESS